MRKWLWPGEAVILAALWAIAALVSAAGPGGFRAAVVAVAPPQGSGRAFLPRVERGRGGMWNPPTPSPTLGPSPTPTRTPTLGPSPTPPPVQTTATPTLGPGPTATPMPPSPTPTPPCDVLKVVWPQRAFLGERLIFTIGLLNYQADRTVQVSLEDTLPQELELTGFWPPTGSSYSVAGNHFELSVAVPPGQALNLFFSAVVSDACGCYVVNSAPWFAFWAGGSRGGTAETLPIFLGDGPTPTPTPGH
jgi:hypothetical protein